MGPRNESYDQKFDDMKIAGADGCKAGWICLVRQLETGAIEAHCFASARHLLHQQPAPALLCIDIPIGLTDAGPRDCDVAARTLLGPPRASSVFPAPIRPVLEARSWEEACAIRQRLEGKRMSKQAWGIVGKVRDVDRELHSHAALRDRVHEVHPEVSFAAWAGHAMRHPKRSRTGRAERLALIASYFGPDAYPRVRARFPAKHVAHDDIADAFAVLWTAERIAHGTARTLPVAPPHDPHGLRMEIVH
jgi:predicted RNase H-like nuclease